MYSRIRRTVVVSLRCATALRHPDCSTVIVRLNLRAGEWVRVRSKAAILSTLDQDGQLQGLPFMPEMFAYCGKRFRVWKRAHKTCDTVNKTGGLRMTAAVHLEDTRCDGQAHGGCQAECLIFWKEAWLERSGELEQSRDCDDTDDGRRKESGGRRPAEDRVWAGASTIDDDPQATVRYRCQATIRPRQRCRCLGGTFANTSRISPPATPHSDNFSRGRPMSAFTHSSIAPGVALPGFAPGLIRLYGLVSGADRRCAVSQAVGHGSTGTENAQPSAPPEAW